MAYIYIILMNVVTFVLYAYDKQCSKQGKWRIPEFTLLSFSLLGGGLGAFIGMHILHHKTLHKKFQICVPLFFILQLLLLIINL